MLLLLLLLLLMLLPVTMIVGVASASVVASAAPVGTPAASATSAGKTSPASVFFRGQTCFVDFTATGFCVGNGVSGSGGSNTATNIAAAPNATGRNSSVV